MKSKSRAIIIVVLLFASLTYIFAWSPVFQVKDIKVSGLPAGVTQTLILERAQISIGDKLARIEPRTIATRLSTFSWIKDVQLERDWISGAINLKISSRVPLGIYRGRALDKNGVLFDLPSGAPSGLPEVSAARPDLGLLAISLFKLLPTDLRTSLLALSAKHESSITSVHQRGSREIKIQWGSSQEMTLKVKVYRALLELPENREITSVDLSAPHAPIVK